MCWGMKNRRKQQQGILPSQRYQLAYDYLLWGICSACGPSTVGQVTKIKGFSPVGARYIMYIFVFFSFKYDMQVPIDWKCRLIENARSVHNVMRRFLPLVLGSLASKSHTQQEIKSNYLPIPKEQDCHLLMSNVSCACIIKRNYR